MTSFRKRLLATLRAARGLLEEPGVLVVGSQVPNLLQAGAASTLLVSQDVDLAIPVSRIGRIKQRLAEMDALVPSAEEPSVWVPRGDDLIELNLLGTDDATSGPAETYVYEDAALPLMVFSLLSLLRPGRVVEVDGLAIPLPRPAGLIVEKLLSDRSGEKGERDLLVVAGLFAVTEPHDVAEAVNIVASLTPELRHTARSNLAILSLMSERPQMPSPRRYRGLISELLARLDAREARE